MLVAGVTSASGAPLSQAASCMPFYLPAASSCVVTSGDTVTTVTTAQPPKRRFTEERQPVKPADLLGYEVTAEVASIQFSSIHYFFVESESNLSSNIMRTLFLLFFTYLVYDFLRSTV